MDEALSDITKRIQSNAFTAFIESMCADLAREIGYSEDLVGEDGFEEAASELVELLKARLSEERTSAGVFEAFISDILEDRYLIRKPDNIEPYEIEIDQIILNIIDIVMRSKVACTDVVNLPMPATINESSLKDNAAYLHIAQVLKSDVQLLDRPAEVSINNMIKAVSKGSLCAFACYARNPPHGKCTLQGVFILRNGKALRLTISTPDASSKPREWVLRRVDLADEKDLLSKQNKALSLEARVTFSESNVNSLKSINPYDREFANLIGICVNALSGNFIEKVLNDSEEGKRIWKSTLGSDSISNYAGALDCTSKYSGFKLEYREVNNGTEEQIAAYKGSAMFRFRKQISQGEELWRSKLHGARKQNKKSEEAKQKKQSKLRSKELKPELKEINMADALVRSIIGSCARKNHKLTSFRGRVSIITRKGALVETTFPITYCENCKKYFIREEVYNRLRAQGIICCRIVEEVHAEQKGVSFSRYDDWNDESIIHQYGYNVNAKENLSEKQRHKILSMIIESRIQTKDQIIDFIQMQVDQRSGRPNMENAVAKWKSDINYLVEYKVQKSAVEIRSMRTKR